MAPVTEIPGITQEEDKPPSYDGDCIDQTTSTAGKIIKVDDAIEQIGFGKFQRRVL